MYSLSSGDVSYMVPLDHVDLKYLRRHEQIGDYVKPLWSLHQEEYTEFQLKAWRRPEDDEEQLDKNAKITTMCHICDTQVPVIYLKEHFNSKKHMNFLKIINESISRLTNNINSNAPTVSPIEPSKFNYFCEVCCITVMTNDKEIHEGSATHKKLTKHDKIIEKLLIAFKRDIITDTNDAIDKSIDGNKASEPTKQESKVTTPLEHAKEYINAITQKITPNTIKIDVLDENYIVINTSNSVRVHIDNFNGFVNVNQGLKCLLCNATVISKNDHIWTDRHMTWVIQRLSDDCIRQIDQHRSHCIICNELIESVGGHKELDSNHKNKLKNALYNTLNSATYDQTPTLMRNAEPAAACQENKKTKENHDVLNGENIETQTENTGAKFVHSHQTQTSTTTFKKSVAAHLENKKTEENHDVLNGENVETQTENTGTKIVHSHQTQITCKISAAAHLENKKTEENIKTQTENKEVKFVHYMICRTDLNFKDVTCRLCTCVISDSKMNIEEHLSGNIHTDKYNDLLSINHMNKIRNGFSCDICLIHVPDNTELEHVSSKNHKTKMKNGIKKNQTYCELCMIYVHRNNLKHHRNGQTHRQKALKQTTANENAISHLVAGKTFAMATTNSAQDISLSKPQGPKATDTSQTISAQNMKVKNISPSSVTNIQSSVLEKSRNGPSDESDQPSTSTMNLKSPTHSLESSNTQTPSELKNIQPKKNIAQPVENINEPSTSGLKKGQTAPEMKNIQPLKSLLDKKSTISENKTLSDVGNIQPSSSQMKSVEPELKMKPHYHLKETSDSKQLFCKVCNVQVPNTLYNITSHIDGINHKTTYKNLLQLNNVVQVESNYHCHKCNVHITNRNEIDHILGNRHKNALSDDSLYSRSDTSDQYSNSEPPRIEKNTEYKAKLYFFDKTSMFLEIYCKVCHIHMFDTVDNVINHTNGDSHLTKYNNFLKRHYIVKLEDAFFCNMCEENVSSQFELRHVASTKHRDREQKLTRLAEFKTKQYLFDFETSTPQVAYCKVCHTNVFNTVDNVINHTNRNSHLTKYNHFLERHNMLNLGDGFFCNSCDVYVSSQYEILHVSTCHEFILFDTPDDDDDDASESDFISEAYCGFCDIFVPPTDYLNHKISVAHDACVENVSQGALEVHYYVQTLQSYLVCEWCKCKVNNEYECAIEHLEGCR